MENFTSDILAKDEGIFDAEAVVPGWAVANLPVNGTVRFVSQYDLEVNERVWDKCAMNCVP